MNPKTEAYLMLIAFALCCFIAVMFYLYGEPGGSSAVIHPVPVQIWVLP